MLGASGMPRARSIRVPQPSSLSTAARVHSFPSKSGNGQQLLRVLLCFLSSLSNHQDSDVTCQAWKHIIRKR